MKYLSNFAMIAWVSGAIVAGTACKGETTYKDKRETLDRLEAQNAQLAEKDALIKTYEAKLFELEKSAGANEILVTIEGDALAVRPAKPGGTMPPGVDDKRAADLSKDFLALVSKSRPAIQKCYEQALKKNQAYQARTVTLKIAATFASGGAYQRGTFTHPLGAGFDQCLSAIGNKWVLANVPQQMTFQASVSLTPS